MEPLECMAAINDLAETGWAYRNLLLTQGPLTAEMVTLENALHHLEQSLATLRSAVLRLPPTE